MFSSKLFQTVERDSLSRKHIVKSLIISVTASCFGFAWVTIALGMPLTLLLERLGATGFEIGLLVSVQQIPLMLQVPTAIVLERFHARKIYWFLFALFHRMLWFTPAVVPFVLGATPAAVYTVVIMVGFSTVFAQMATPVWLGWMADLLPRDLSAKFWALRQAAVTMISVITLFLIGYVLDRFSGPNSFIGFSILFVIAGLTGMADIILHVLVPEPKPHISRITIPVMKKIELIFKNADFMWLTISMMLWYFGLAMIAVFGVVFMKRELRLDYTGISIFVIIGSIGAFAMSPLLGKLAERFGARTLCALILVLGPVMGIGWFFVEPGNTQIELSFLGIHSIPTALYVMLIPQLIAGGFYSGVGLYQMHLSGILSRPHGRMLQMSVHWSLIGGLSALGALIGGKIVDYFKLNPPDMQLYSMPMTYYHVLVIVHLLISLSAAIVLLKVKIKGTDISMADVFRMVRVANPLRAVIGFYGSLIPFGDAPGKRKK